MTKDSSPRLPNYELLRMAKEMNTGMISEEEKRFFSQLNSQAFVPMLALLYDYFEQGNDE